jgi:hypothetical protein
MRMSPMVGMFFCCGCVIYDTQYVDLFVFLHNYPVDFLLGHTKAEPYSRPDFFVYADFHVNVNFS